MASFNKTILMGHTTRDVELRFTPKGAAVGEFAIAVNHTWTNEAGERKEEVSFFNCVVFGKQAETLAQYVKKGDPLFLEGRLKQETWEDKQTGQKRQAVKVIVNQFQFLNRAPAKDGQQQRSEPAARPNHRAAAGLPAEEAPPQDDGDNVPF